MPFKHDVSSAMPVSRTVNTRVSHLQVGSTVDGAQCNHHSVGPCFVGDGRQVEDERDCFAPSKYALHKKLCRLYVHVHGLAPCFTLHGMQAVRGNRETNDRFCSKLCLIPLALEALD